MKRPEFCGISKMQSVLKGYAATIRELKETEQDRWVRQLIAQAEYNLNAASRSVGYLVGIAGEKDDNV